MDGDRGLCEKIIQKLSPNRIIKIFFKWGFPQNGGFRKLFLKIDKPQKHYFCKGLENLLFATTPRPKRKVVPNTERASVSQSTATISAYELLTSFYPLTASLPIFP